MDRFTGWNVLEALPDQAALIDGNGVIVRTNQAWKDFAEKNGGSPDSVDTGSRYLDVCVPTEESPDLLDVQVMLSDVIRGDSLRFAYEYPCHSPTQKRWFLMRAGHLEPSGALVTHTDITNRKLAELENEALANHDPLTKTLNRRGLASCLQQELARSRRRGDPLAVMLIDCDDFKSVNSRYGHAAGDIVLVELTRRFCEALRPEDVLARIGGDELVVLLPETKRAEASIVAERLRLASMSLPFLVAGDAEVHLTCSISVAQADEHVAGLDDILKLCNDGLSASKQHGKNRVSNEYKASTGSGSDPAELAAVVIKAARQPIVDLATGKRVGYEFLARGSGAYERPVDLFRRALETQVLQRVDLACLNASIVQLSKIATSEIAHINIYPSTLLSIDDDYLLRRIPDRALRERVCLELCEQEIIGDPMHLRDKVQALRKLGFTLAIDDVGFGRTCLENLVLLEPETIKIDRRFVDGVAGDPSKARQLERILRIAATLGAIVVVEGVETKQDADACLALGAALAQGYLWGRPTIVE
jgi:diguanylate cyclase (GGDEF)-like protein